MKRKIIIGCVALFIVVCGAVGLALGSRAGRFADGVRILVEDRRDGSVAVTNVGRVTMAATVWFQVLSNGVWMPPKEELYVLPYGILLGQGAAPPKGARGGDAGHSIRYRFAEQAQGDAPWRVIVLCQEYYPETILGQVRYFMARHVTDRGKFADGDHRGPRDEWVYGEAMTNEPNASAF